MHTIIVFKELIEINGDETIGTILKQLSEQVEWKNKFPDNVSAGWQWIDSNHQRHYLKRDTLSYVAAYFYETNQTFLIRAATSNEYSPIDKFEEWDAPPNQEAAITMGYLDAPHDYEFIIPYYHRNAFGAWRSYPPVI